MKAVRLIAGILFYISRVGAVFLLITGIYEVVILLLSYYTSLSGLPVNIEQGYFTIFFPFTHKPFLLGDYTKYYFFTSVLTVVVYGFFLWLLSSVFQSFRQKKLFTQQGVNRLARFYIINLAVPALFL